MPPPEEEGSLWSWLTGEDDEPRRGESANYTSRDDEDTFTWLANSANFYAGEVSRTVKSMTDALAEELLGPAEDEEGDIIEEEDASIRGNGEVVTGGAIKQCSGTRGYWAPEMVKGDRYLYSGDWWTLGVLIYEMVAGRTPFCDTDPRKVFLQIVQSAEVLLRPWCILEIHAAVTNAIPIVSVALRGKAYDFAEAQHVPVAREHLYVFLHELMASTEARATRFRNRALGGSAARFDASP